MGMAASQARYLEITARKTNVEYEGQQINQQRTALANESSGMFAQLMALQVPVPPSTSDYTTSTYSFNNGANDNVVDSINPLTGDPNYNSNVTYHYTQSVYKGIGQLRTDLGVMGTGTTADPYWLTNGTTTKQTKLSQCAATDTNYDAEKAALEQICKNNPTSTLIAALGYNSTTGTIDPTRIGNAYTYSNVSGTTYYYSATDLAASTSTTGNAVALTGYYTGNIDQKISNTEKAYVTYASSGRASTIQLSSTAGTTFDMTSVTTTDETAYNNAMNEYEYQQQNYQQEVTAINAKTCIIQQQDKTLELQLKQLDTEQQALSTEMDSVKKVIDKNIEQTFKTFSS